MKKIFSLFIATVVALSMFALPQNVKLAGKKAKPASKEQFEAKTPAQAKTLEFAKDAKVLRHFERVEKDVKKLPAKSPLKVAAAQTADTVKLHYDGFSIVPEYYEESGDWYMACSDGEGYIVKFDIFSDSYVGTFTEEDLDLEYSYLYTPEDYVEYVKVDLTITETQVSEYLTTINFFAVIDGTDGNVYVVTCVHSILSPKSTVNHTVEGAILEFDGEKFVLAGKNADLDLNLSVWATWPTGRYTQGEFDWTETTVQYKGVEQQLTNTEMLVASALLEDGTTGYVADLSYFNQDTILHEVTVVAPLPAATDTIHISMNNLKVDDSWADIFGWVYLTAISKEWDVYGGVSALEIEAGEWAGEDEVMLYITNLTTYENLEAIYGLATVTEDPELGWVAQIKGHCTDGNYYVVDMKFEIPEVTDTVKITFPTTAKQSFYPDLQNDLTLYNDNGEYFVALDVYNVPFGGEFTLDDMDKSYSQLIDWVDSAEVQIADVKGVLDQKGDTTTMVADIIGFDGILYQVELVYAVPTPKEVVELTVEAEFVNELELSGYYTLTGTAKGTDLLVSMSPTTEEVAGTFVNDGLFGKFGAEGGRYDFFSTYTYVAKPTGKFDEDGEPTYDVYKVDKGTMTVTVDADNKIVAKASVICSNAVQYEITITSTFEKPHLNYDSETPVQKKYTATDIVTTEYDAEYGMVFWQVEAADGSDVCALYFFVEEADADIVIPAGEYTIDDSMDYGTVYASTGYDEYYGAVSPSLYATYHPEYPDSLDELWFMVGGSVTVEKVDGLMKMTINAINSYDQEIHITYDATATGVENINVNVAGVHKQIVDGQLIIIRDGKAYNVQGLQVK